MSGDLLNANTRSNKNVPSIALNDQQINMNHIDSSDMVSPATTTFSSSSSSGGAAAGAAAAAATTTTSAATRKEEIFSASNIFDLIHGVQINCECSPLDKENSHFVIADLAIAAIELIKTSHQQRKATIDESRLSSMKPKYTPSPSIRIRSNQQQRGENKNKNTTAATIVEATESFLDLTLENHSSSISPLPSATSAAFDDDDDEQQTSSRHGRKSLSMVAVIPISVETSFTRPTTRRRSLSLNDLTTSASTSQLPPLPPPPPTGGSTAVAPPTSKASASFMLFENSVDSSSFSTADMSSSFSTSPPPPPAANSSSSFLLRNPTDSRLLKFSSPPPNNRLPDQPSRLTCTIQFKMKDIFSKKKEKKLLIGFARIF